ncbi:hypothetical protein CUMW_270910 [Citrus unshiu]|uniref:Uncharacterized protein n=1 Tax=Citrus unshiu TaxID=55188 RepID=A0A2H5QXG5_CITUN|nr:hypothetical protein CUMW_270910 [Citrus unshiu]
MALGYAGLPRPRAFSDPPSLNLLYYFLLALTSNRSSRSNRVRYLSVCAHSFSSFGTRGSRGTSNSSINAKLGLWGTSGTSCITTSTSIGLTLFCFRGLVVYNTFHLAVLHCLASA